MWNIRHIYFEDLSIGLEDVSGIVYEVGAWIKLALDKILFLNVYEHSNKHSGCIITGHFLISGAAVPRRPGTDRCLLPVVGLPFDTFQGTVL
jgi:hypothetical protein